MLYFITACYICLGSASTRGQGIRFSFFLQCSATLTKLLTKNRAQIPEKWEARTNFGFSKNVTLDPRAERTFFLIFNVASLISYCRPSKGPLCLSLLIRNHCFPQCVTELFQTPLYEHLPWSQGPAWGRLSSMLNWSLQPPSQIQNRSLGH